jgi:cell shape-determining protein MreC
MKKYSSITKANSRRSTTKPWRKGLFISLALFLFGWIFPTVFSFVSGVVLYPVHSVTSWYQYSESVLPLFLRSRVELAAEIGVMKAELENRSGTDLAVDRLLAENMQLRAVAETNTPDARLVARVIAQPSLLSYDLLQIDKGTDAGVVVGAPVFLGIDTVVGVVVHTAPTYAFVELVTTSGFEATAYVVGPNIFAPIEGVGGGIARVRVPQGIALREGNLVLLPSVSGGVYGEIVTIVNDPTQPEQYGYVSPPVPLQSMLYVSVGTERLEVRDESVIEDDIRRVVREYFRMDVPLTWSDVTVPVATTTATASVQVDE